MWLQWVGTGWQQLPRGTGMWVVATGARSGLKLKRSDRVWGLASACVDRVYLIYGSLNWAIVN
jgi:hypothetical protein